MAEENVTPPDVVKVITILKLEDGTVIDASELSSEQREAYIEFAIHLAAPKIAKLITQGVSQQLSGFDAAEQPNINEAYYKYPVMMTTKEAAEMLNVSESMIRQMERRWNGKFFPAVRMGSKIRIPRDELIQWIKDGGMNKYHEEIKKADEEYERQKYRYSSSSKPRKIAPKMK